MSKIQYFPEGAYLELFDNIEANQANYALENNDWIKKVFGDRNYSKESRISAGLPILNVADGEYSNIIAIYNAFKDKLTPKQASNPYLWSWLTHNHYWKYTHDRWAKEGMSVDTIRQRFFCSFLTKNPEGNRVGFLRNAIARLWWMGYLTYQEDHPSNPFELTKLLVTNTDLCQSIIERNFSMNRNITIGILKAILEINNTEKKEVGVSPIEGEAYEWRDLCKYINRYGAVSVLDALTSEEIKEISYNYILSQREKAKREIK
jgi:hypothetical protein